MTFPDHFILFGFPWLCSLISSQIWWSYQLPPIITGLQHWFHQQTSFVDTLCRSTNAGSGLIHVFQNYYIGELACVTWPLPSLVLYIWFLVYIYHTLSITYQILPLHYSLLLGMTCIWHLCTCPIGRPIIRNVIWYSIIVLFLGWF